MKTTLKLLIAIVAVTLAVPAGVATASLWKADPPEGCEYQWNGTAWSLVDSNCPTGTCNPPVKVGAFIGQTLFVRCTPDPVSGCDCGQ